MVMFNNKLKQRIILLNKRLMEANELLELQDKVIKKQEKGLQLILKGFSNEKNNNGSGKKTSTEVLYDTGNIQKV